MTPGPAKVATVHWMLGQLGESTTDFSGNGGLGGSCYGCPFASAPQDQRGVDADPYWWRNDPSEAWFTCSLPTRDPEAPKPQWGEYAPCTHQEWVAHLLAVVPDGPAVDSGYAGRHRSPEAADA